MVFNSTEFTLFFGLFFLLYWVIFNKSVKAQNILLLVGSYVFYAWWDWRFLSLLIGSSLINFYLGLFIYRKPNYRRLFLYIGVIFGVGSLWFFKYYNFFITSLSTVFEKLDLNINTQTLNLILPLGISFYTFRTLSYLLDIYKGKTKPTTNGITFFTYVSFFPSLLSGPIDKARDFIPSLEKKRVFKYQNASGGLRQILWGLFKKIVIADNCAIITDDIFNNYPDFSGSTLVVGAAFFTIQAYADFSGYTDMAIGFARLLGFKIAKNFDFPFFSQNIAEYWRKWHISLTSWMTEYVFNPLAFIYRDLGKLGIIFAILINFLIIGIWHGANWTYLLFGLLNGLYFIPLIIKGNLNSEKQVSPTLFSKFKAVLNGLGTFTLVILTGAIFRSETVEDAFHYLSKIFSISVISIPEIRPRTLSVLIIIFMLFEWFGRKNEFAIETYFQKKGRFLRWAFYFSIIICIFLYSVNTRDFIYFQF